MNTRVVNVRDLLATTSGAEELKCIYVGRYMIGMFKGHPLANPYRVAPDASMEERKVCLAAYREWLDSLAVNSKHLHDLAQSVQRTGKPLGCWCGNYPEDPELVCHAVVLAKRVDEILSKQAA